MVIFKVLRSFELRRIMEYIMVVPDNAEWNLYALAIPLYRIDMSLLKVANAAFV